MPGREQLLLTVGREARCALARVPAARNGLLPGPHVGDGLGERTPPESRRRGRGRVVRIQARARRRRPRAGSRSTARRPGRPASASRRTSGARPSPSREGRRPSAWPGCRARPAPTSRRCRGRGRARSAARSRASISDIGSSGRPGTSTSPPRAIRSIHHGSRAVTESSGPTMQPPRRIVDRSAPKARTTARSQPTLSQPYAPPGPMSDGTSSRVASGSPSCTPPTW